MINDACFIGCKTPYLQAFTNSNVNSIQKISTLLVSLVFSTIVLGQGDVNSPFSRFGIGDLEEGGFMHTRLMGGIGTSFVDIYHLNFENPASLSHLKRTGFDIGVTANRSTLNDQQVSSEQWSGNLSYIGLGFPLRNPLNEAFSREGYDLNLGMGFALRPYSTVSYSITTRDQIENIGEFDRNFSGSGGLYNVLWSNSIRYKNLSFGINTGYIFGKIDYERNIDFIDELNAFDNQFSNSFTARGFTWDVGFLYTLTLNQTDLDRNPGTVEPKILSFGVTAKANTGISTSSDVRNVNFSQTALFIPAIDSVFVQDGVSGNGTLPSELGIGLNYNLSNKLLLGVDYQKTFWSNYKNDARPETLSDTYRLGFGGYYRPNYKSQNSLAARMYYRFGFYYEQDPRIIEGERISSYGITFGFGFPFIWQRRDSNMNLGFNIGKRSVDGILEENFVKISFGFTFNDTEWFIKRKFN